MGLGHKRVQSILNVGCESGRCQWSCRDRGIVGGMGLCGCSCVLSLQMQYTESMYSANGMGSARRVSTDSAEEHVLEGSFA